MTAPKTYDFEHNGTTFTIPSFSALPIGAIRKVRKQKEEIDQAFALLEAVMPEDSAELAAIDSMSGEEFEAFFKGWTQGANLGESSSSEN